MKKVIMFTDGSCQGNPGIGGYGTTLRYGEYYKEFSAGFRMTTNNRMELLAVIIGLEKLNYPCEVVVYSDSMYVINGIRKGWARKWQKRNWMRTKKHKASNSDLWYRLLKQMDKHDVTLKWVKGHSGNVGNERADALANAACRNKNLLIDKQYPL